jgi:hypothetical protein
MQRLAALVPRPRLHLIRVDSAPAPNANQPPTLLPTVAHPLPLGLSEPAWPWS